MSMNYNDDRPHEECGVFGMYDISGGDVADSIYYGLYALQHRGQESCGIAVNDDGSFLVHKSSGLVTDVFDEVTLSALEGTCAIGRISQRERY